MLTRPFLIKTHLILAGFFLPITLIYMISGLLYTLDIKGHIHKQKLTHVLEKPFEPNLDQLTHTVKQTLQAHKLPIPQNNPKLEKKKASYVFTWSDLRYTVIVKTTDDIHKVILTHRTRNLLAQMMRIHRAQAGWVLSLMTLVTMAAWLFVFASGIYMAYTMPKLRRVFMLSLLLGGGLLGAIFLI